MSSRETIGGRSLGAVAEDGMNGGGGGGAYPGPNPGPFGGDCEGELKQLLFVNLDLIQHQEELLMSNNRTIVALRRENEMLKCRLDRIERRMSLVYHKGLNMSSTTASAQSGAGPHQHPDTRPTRSSSRRKLDLETADDGSESTDKPKDLPGKSESEVDSKAKMEEFSEAACLKTPASRASLRRSAGKLTPGRCKTSRRSEPLLTAPDAEIPLKQPRLDDVIAGDRTEARQERMRRRIRRNSDLLMTETLYYVPPLPSAVDIEDEEDIDVLCQEEIVVPTWRVRHLSTLYVMEGTENLDDRVFLKRHQKFETEEKRRKRWDIQRLKDLQLLRKRQMKEEKSQAEAQDIATFLPRTDRALYIEVNDMVPVSAFGYPLPTMQTVEFHLPWYNASKDSVAKNKRFRKT